MSGKKDKMPPQQERRKTDLDPANLPFPDRRKKSNFGAQSGQKSEKIKKHPKKG